VPDRSFPKKDFTIGRWRSRVSKAPEVMGELPVSVMAEEIETPGEGRIRALITIAGNPVLGIPESDRLDKALSSLDFMISVDYYINETTRQADVILPPASILCHGHYDFFFHGLAIRNFACYSPPVFEKKPDEKDKWEILAHLALIAAGEGSRQAPAVLAEKIAADLAQRVVTAMGGAEKSGVSPDMLTGMLSGATGPERLLDFLLRTGPYGDAFGMNPEGLNFEKLKNSVHGMDLGPLTPWLDKAIVNPDGKIHLFPEVLQKEMAALAEEMPSEGAGDDRLRLVGRRHLRSNNSWMHNISILVKNNPCTLCIHPEDAAALGIEAGAIVRIASEAGTIEAPAEVTEAVMPGVVSLPHGWGHDMKGVRMRVASANPGVNVNRITPAEFDRISGTAVLNGIPVSVSPA
jgi:anaerobic selenocysteine-containing dehydrogenase